jgi:hypothetical protein
MKTKNFILLFVVALIIILISSCKKQEYCETCVEATSGEYQHYCGNDEDCYTFEFNLKSSTAASGKTWNCTKTKK